MLEQIFKESKQRIMQEIENGVKTIGVNRPTCLLTVFNRTWIGYFLFQKHCNCATKAGPACGEDHEVNPNWLSVHRQCRITICASRRGGVGSSIQARVLPNVYIWMHRTIGNSGLQAPNKNLLRQSSGKHKEPKTI